MSSAQKKGQLEKLFSTLNQHKLEEALEFYDKNYQLAIGDKVIVNGIDEMKSLIVKQFADPNYSQEVVEYLPIEGDDKLRARLKTNDNKHYDITYVFSKETPSKLLRASVTPIDG